MNKHSVFSHIVAFSIASVIFTFTFVFSATAYGQQKTTEKAADSTESAAEQKTAKEKNPAVAALMANNPTTPSECIRTAQILADLNRPELARPLLKKALDAGLNERQLAALAKEFGSPTFAAFAVKEQLQPEGKKLADAVLDAAQNTLQRPERIAALIKQLQDSSAQKRQEAMAGLLDARQAAAVGLIAVLADADRSEEHPIVREALLVLGKDAFSPLVYALESDDPKLTAQVVAVLGAMQNARAELFLLRPCFAPDVDPAVKAEAQAALKNSNRNPASASQAVDILSTSAKRYLDHIQPQAGTSDDFAQVWAWNPDKKELIEHTTNLEDSSRALAARLARDAFAIAPNNPNAQKQYITAELELAAYQKGLDKPLEEDDCIQLASSKKLGARAVSDALDFALANNYRGAAIASTRLLGEIGTAEELLYASATPSPLARAAVQSDRRLRFAALQSILALKPEKPFAGSSAIVPQLTFFAATGGTRKVLLAGGKIEEMREIVPTFTAAGYSVESAGYGRDALRLMLNSPDYEMVFIDAGINIPTIEHLLQQIRHDCRSADMRVGVSARDGFGDKAERVVEKDPMARTFARPHDEAAIQWQIEQLGKLSPREFVPADERQRQAAEALSLLASLADRPKLYDLRAEQDVFIALTGNPEQRSKAIEILAKINSPEAQRTLADIASRNSLPIDARQAAAASFRDNVKQNGILLKSGEIKMQYTRYNESERQDAETQQVLGLILDALEKKK